METNKLLVEMTLAEDECPALMPGGRISCRMCKKCNSSMPLGLVLAIKTVH